MGKEERNYLKKIKFSIPKNLDNKKIIIYGAGILFEEAYKTYDFSKLHIIGISDKKFCNENSPKEFLGLKTINPDEIENYKADILLVAIKEYQDVINLLLKRYNIAVFPLFKKSILIYKQRNLLPVYNIQINGLHNKKKKNYSNLKKSILSIQTKFNYIFGKIDIPQIEFTITTKCTLRCKHCCNYIPEINENEHSLTTLEAFKNQLDNLLKAVNNVHNLILIGGEPLILKDLNTYLEYACSKKQVKNVWIVTNGTLLMNKELIKSIKKYHKKVTVWVSNYSKNQAIQPRLKHAKLLEQIQETGSDYDYIKDLNWSYTSPINSEKLRDDSSRYFEICQNNCVMVLGGKLYVCPRAGIFDLKKIYTPKENEIIDLSKENNPKILKQKLKEFYSRDYFTACNYCTVLEDKKKEKVIPALQKD